MLLEGRPLPVIVTARFQTVVLDRDVHAVFHSIDRAPLVSWDETLACMSNAGRRS